MNEHPILFKSDMVKAILDNRKTQTRRVPVERYCNWKVGDRLWVREAFCYGKMFGYDARDDGGEVWYRATDAGMCEGPWKPPIHMFQKHARIWLEITGLRVERVQDIKASDILEEGTLTRNYPDLAQSKAQMEWLWDRFRNLWDSINAKRGYGWDKNPEVKVIAFTRIK